MIATIIYSILAILTVVLTAVLVRQARGAYTGGIEPETENLRARTDAQSLRLAARIFDPADYLWLRNELGFPQGAELLARHRRAMALEWLRALRGSYLELLRVPEAPGDGAVTGCEPTSWKLLWLAMRFHMLVAYALFVVRFFGPYHSVVPSLQWVYPRLAFLYPKEHLRTPAVR